MTQSPRSSRIAQLLTVILVAASAAACSGRPLETTTPEGLSVVGAAGFSFSASGEVTYAAGSIVPSTFAVAVADSTGGIVIAAYNQKADRGDLFIIQLRQNRLGMHEPCSSIGSDTPCHGRLIENITASSTLDMSRFEIGAGKVMIDQTADRLKGSISGVLLTGAESRGAVEGTLDLPIVEGDEAKRILRCFLATAQGQTCP